MPTPAQLAEAKAAAAAHAVEHGLDPSSRKAEHAPDARFAEVVHVLRALADDPRNRIFATKSQLQQLEERLTRLERSQTSVNPGPLASAVGPSAVHESLGGGPGTPAGGAVTKGDTAPETNSETSPTKTGLQGLVSQLGQLHQEALAEVAALAPRGDGNEADVAVLRELLVSGQRVATAVQEKLQALVVVGEATSRAGYLRSLGELIGPPPEHSWQDREWESLEREKGTNWTLAESKTAYKPRINALIESGWTREHAETYQMLVGGRGPIGQALREGSPRYAAATYALSEALFARRQTPGGALPQMLYWALGPGYGSLLDTDPAWGHLQSPDRTGFCGITAAAPTKCNAMKECMSPEGYRVQITYPDRPVEYKLMDSDIVGFESAPDDEHGYHTAVMLQDNENGAFPPNTLFRLKRVMEAGSWEGPGGVYPRQRLLIVTATYRPPRAGPTGGGGAGKMCEPAVSLRFGSRKEFVRGLDDLLAQTCLTLAQELDRPIRWTDWRGVAYDLRTEYEYVRGPAKAEGCAPGARDANNCGKTLDVFMDAANAFIKQRRAALAQSDGAVLLPEQYAFLGPEEVIAVRMYTGPAFQPINAFLRDVGQLQGVHRMRLAQDPASTFAATTWHLCMAIRKLAAVASPAEASQPLFRGIRGELPRAFWVPDEQGMVCAVDMGFLSTSRNRSTIEFMGGGKNVLWELRPKPQSDAAFHCGADVKMLSQFAEEDEVLFPPCTMFEVLPCPADAVRDEGASPPDRRPSLGRDALMKGLQVEERYHDDKTFLAIKVQPSFI